MLFRRERWVALPGGGVRVTNDGSRGSDGVIKHPSRAQASLRATPTEALQDQSSAHSEAGSAGTSAAEGEPFRETEPAPSPGIRHSTSGPAIGKELEKIKGVQRSVGRRQAGLRGGRGVHARHSTWPEGPLQPHVRQSAAEVAMGRLVDVTVKIDAASSVRAPPLSVDGAGADYYQRAANASSAQDFIGYTKSRIANGRRSPHRYTPSDHAARAHWARPGAASGNGPLPLKRRLRPPTPDGPPVVRAPSRLFGGKVSEEAVANAGSPGSDAALDSAIASLRLQQGEDVAGGVSAPWTDVETVALITAVEQGAGSWEAVSADMWAAGFERSPTACQERHWWIHHKDFAEPVPGAASPEDGAERVLRQCLAHALRIALHPRSTGGPPPIAEIQRDVGSNLRELPAPLQQGFDKHRMDAGKIAVAVCALLPDDGNGEAPTLSVRLVCL